MSVAQENRCEERHPLKRLPCVMGQGHAGPHRLGGIEQRDITETWVTICEDECVVQEHLTGIHAGFLVCLHCGNDTAMQCSPEESELYAREREKAWKSMADQLRSERDYHAVQHHEWEDKYKKDTADLLRQVSARDVLIETVMENLGMEPHEHYLLDRHSKEAAIKIEILTEERKEIRQAWQQVHDGVMLWTTKHHRKKSADHPIQRVLGDRAWKATGVLNRVFNIR